MTNLVGPFLAATSCYW